LKKSGFPSKPKNGHKIYRTYQSTKLISVLKGKKNTENREKKIAKPKNQKFLSAKTETPI